MACPDPNTIYEFVRGEASAATASQVEEHLDECPVCLELVAAAAAQAPDGEPTESPAAEELMLPRAARGLRVAMAAPAATPASDSGQPAGVASVPRTKLDRYRIIGLLGSGGMGAVYSAYDPDLERKLAIKLMHAAPASPGASAQARARLLREGRAIARLSHPNVVTVYDVGVADDEVFIAMELVEGVTLSAWLAEPDRGWQEVLAAFLQAGRGLAAAHGAGILHRDFKPSNVMVSADGRVRVLDFGLARALDEQSADAAPVANPGPPSSSSGLSTAGAASADNADGTPWPPQPPVPRGFTPTISPTSSWCVTRTGVVLGTPAYMAPEQAQGHGSSAASDQFSFCVALYEGLYGCRPFDGPSPAAIREAGLAGRVRQPPPEQRVPSALHAVLARGLRPDPAARFAGMDELLSTLEGVAAQQDRGWRTEAALLARAATDGLRYRARPGARLRLPSPWWMWGAAVGLAGGALATFFLLGGNTRSPVRVTPASERRAAGESAQLPATGPVALDAGPPADAAPSGGRRGAAAEAQDKGPGRPARRARLRTSRKEKPPAGARPLGHPGGSTPSPQTSPTPTPAGHLGEGTAGF